MIIFSQFKINGIHYTLKAVPTKEFPSSEIPYEDNIIAQFKDICENHAALALEKVERPAVLATAAEQAREYFAMPDHVDRVEVHSKRGDYTL